MFRAPPMLLPHESTAPHGIEPDPAMFTPGETVELGPLVSNEISREVETDQNYAAAKQKAIDRAIQSKLPNMYASEPDSNNLNHDLDNDEPEEEDDGSSSAAEPEDDESSK